ncbi:hypothetical protein ALC56_13003 [Trachymyrmex septentrionalis]|uniref:Uncharacterized protein n=1 Tax=Trachymyrmex septentrionalis TaxID=34720 RepID=A0A195EXW8_9HYME|nr:hypothetical protein ALC56_13003 [Trachymyrmex septentrionalis]
MRGPPRRLRRAENTPVVQSDRQGVIAAIVRRREGGGKSSVVGGGGGGSGGEGGVELVVWMPVLEGGVRKRAVLCARIAKLILQHASGTASATELVCPRIRLDALQCALVNIKTVVQNNSSKDNAMSLKGKDVTAETSSSLRSEKVRSCCRQIKENELTTFLKILVLQSVDCYAEKSIPISIYSVLDSGTLEEFIRISKRQQLEQPVYCETESRRPTTVEDDKQDISGANPEKVKSTTQDLFELLERVQSSRLDDQRCVLPSYFSQVCHKICTVFVQTCV